MAAGRPDVLAGGALGGPGGGGGGLADDDALPKAAGMLDAGGGGGGAGAGVGGGPGGADLDAPVLLSACMLWSWMGARGLKPGSASLPSLSLLSPSFLSNPRSFPAALLKNEDGI